MHSHLDTLTRDLTGFESFQAMLDTHPSYRPSILSRYGRREVDLADAYDAAQAARGDSRRAYRGATPEPPAELPRGDAKASVLLGGVPAHSGLYAEWLRVIHAINGISAAEGDGQVIGSPDSSYNQADGAWVEEYPEYRVILRYTEWGHAANTGTVQAKTDNAEYRLRKAVEEVQG